MSTIGLKYHNEDIHKIIKKPLSPTIKSPRYKSRRTVLFAQKYKYNGHQTFGLAHYEAPESKNFLRKRKPPIVPPAAKLINKKDFRCSSDGKCTSIPKPIFEKVKPTKKNFVKENIKKTLALTPKVPIPRRVETPRGTSKDLAHLLQMIKIRESEEYGRVPKYLCDRKKRWEKERKRQEREQEALRAAKEKTRVGFMGMNENLYMVDAEARKKILDGLKENWNELSKQFLKLPVMTDTWPKIKRKMCLEKEIEQLEKDIRLVESHPYIYLERMDGRFFEETQEPRGDTEKQAEEQEEVKDAEPMKETKQQKDEEPAEEIVEEKKEEDTEINTYNY